MMTRKKLLAMLLTLIMLLMPMTAAAEDFFPGDNNLAPEIIEDGDTVYAESSDSFGEFTEATSYASAFGANPIDANGTMRSQLSAQGKKLFDQLNQIGIDKIMAADKDSGGYNQVQFKVDGVTGTKLTGSIVNGSFVYDSASKKKQDTLFQDMAMAIVAYRYDRADALWTTSMKYGYKRTLSTTTDEITDLIFSYKLHHNGKEKQMWEDLMGNASIIASTVKSHDYDRYNQVRYVHDILAYMNEYSTVISDFAYHPSHLAYSALVPNGGYSPVCDGYSKAVKVVLDKLGIPNALASSNSGVHMWNNVKMENGKWYNFDLTWDDGNIVTHDYFLVGSNTVINGVRFRDTKEHKEENPYTSDGAASEATTFYFPDKDLEAYSYSGTIKSYTDIPDTVKVLESDSTFPDVYKSAWYYLDVEKAAEMNLFNGDENGRFNPKNNITRAQIAQVFANYMDYDESKYTSVDFKDVPAKHWAVPAIAWAVEEGYMLGYSNGTFRPNAYITREELCVIFDRLEHLPEKNTSAFPDKNDISGWAKEAVQYCKNIGIVSGDSKGNFNPGNYATRAEAAAIFVRYVDAAE